jgi:hypothetical protein
MEKSRFEAFRRCTLPSNAIRQYLAHLLLQHQEHVIGRCHASTRLLGTTGFGTGLPHLERAMIARPHHRNVSVSAAAAAGLATAKKKTTTMNRPLEDMVQPGDADSIVVVVSALAKAYAQRLVTAARRVATVMMMEEERGSGGGGGGATAVVVDQEQKPLQVQHIQMAYDARVQAGIDPGFFMYRPKSVVSSVVGKIAAAAVGIVDRLELLRLAALQAQEEYDRLVEEGKSNINGVGNEMKEEDESIRLSSNDEPNVSLIAEPQDSPQRSMEVDLLEDEKDTEEVEETLLSSSPKAATETKSVIEEEFNTSLPQLEENPIIEVIAPNMTSTTTSSTVPPAPTASKSARSEPMSMEDALLNDLDDDSDDDDDD